MSVMITLEMPIKSEKLEEYLGIMKQALVDTRNYKGCESGETYVEKEKSVVCLVERWNSVEDQKAYMAWRMETGLLEALGPYLDGELVNRFFDIHADV